MSVLRRKNRTRFLVVEQDVVEDMSISLQAKGLLIYLLGMHDDWEANSTHLQKVTGCGKDKINSAIRELVDAGYLVKAGGGRDLGKFARVTYDIHESPIRPPAKADKPQRENRSGKPAAVNPPLTNTYKRTNTNIKKTTSAQAKPARAEPSPVKYSVEDYKLAEHILTGIHQLGVNTKKANMDSWADDVRKMREIDGRSHADIRRVFDWANADSFWQANILSTKKLREKYDQLSIQSKRSNGRHKGSAADLTSKNLAEAKSFMEGN